MDDESGDDDRDELISGWGGELKREWWGWWNESGSWFQRQGDGWLGRLSPKWPTVCRVGSLTLLNADGITLLAHTRTMCWQLPICEEYGRDLVQYLMLEMCHSVCRWKNWCFAKGVSEAKPYYTCICTVSPHIVWHNFASSQHLLSIFDRDVSFS